MTEKTLAGQVAVMTGSSRGIGRGMAIGLGEATVYVTGRSVGDEASAALYERIGAEQGAPRHSREQRVQDPRPGQLLRPMGPQSLARKPLADQ